MTKEIEGGILRKDLTALSVWIVPVHNECNLGEVS
jgi:hypothetical protein